jgi:hypothetical protein
VWGDRLELYYVPMVGLQTIVMNVFVRWTGKPEISGSPNLLGIWMNDPHCSAATAACTVFQLLVIALEMSKNIYDITIV